MCSIRVQISQIQGLRLRKLHLKVTHRLQCLLQWVLQLGNLVVFIVLTWRRLHDFVAVFRPKTTIWLNVARHLMLRLVVSLSQWLLRGGWARFQVAVQDLSQFVILLLNGRVIALTFSFGASAAVSASCGTKRNEPILVEGRVTRVYRQQRHFNFLFWLVLRHGLRWIERGVLLWISALALFQIVATRWRVRRWGSSCKRLFYTRKLQFF